MLCAIEFLQSILFFRCNGPGPEWMKKLLKRLSDSTSCHLQQGRSCAVDYPRGKWRNFHTGRPARKPLSIGHIRQVAVQKHMFHMKPWLQTTKITGRPYYVYLKQKAVLFGMVHPIGLLLPSGVIFNHNKDVFEQPKCALRRKSKAINYNNIDLW